MTVIQRHLTRLDQAIAQLEGGPFYQRRDVAQLIGVTTSALSALDDDKHPGLRPRMAVRWNGQIVKLYSRTELDALMAHFRRPSAGAGRPRIWSTDENNGRRKVRDAIRYYTRRAEEVAASNPEGAHEAASKARELQQQLDAQLDRRMASRVAGQ